MSSILPALLLLGAVAAPAAAASPETPATGPADRIVAALGDPALARLLGDALARNPEAAGLAAAARMAAARAPQAAALPDPTAAVTAYLLPPETRVGPQRLMAGLSQRLPWFGKLALREQAAVLDATAAAARVEAARLRVATEARRLAYELAFLDAWEAVLRQDRATLDHYEELARARYASGMGLEQTAVKIQAEITRDDGRLLDLASRRAMLTASLAALADRPVGEAPAIGPLPRLAELSPDRDRLRREALAGRPEIAEADAMAERARTLTRLAGKEYRPDVTLGLVYALVDPRADRAGRQAPPEGNGADDFGLTAAINLPIWKKRLAAGVEEALQRESQAEATRRAAAAAIEGSLADLVDRLPLTWDRLHLFEGTLRVQSEQSLASAEAAYSAGTLGALDLLDAERTLLEVRTATERARADYAIALAQLEGVVGAPLTGPSADPAADPEKEK